jgi:hypothetical protein
MKKLVLSLMAIALSGSWQMAFAADVTGKITLKGTPPPERTIVFEDPICASLNPNPVTTRHYAVGKDHGLADVFVYITKGLEGKKFTPPTTPVEINQEGCMYHPFVLGVMVGQPLRIKNSDPLMHNIHAIPKNDGNSEFNFAEPSQGDINDTKWLANITAPEVLIRVNCDVHKWMFAYIGVVNNPFYAVSDADGNYKITGLPPGTYTLTAYHLKAHGNKPGESQQITVADKPVTADFTVEVPAPQ